MFYVLSKILGLIINPLVWIITCLIIGLIVKKQKIKKYFLWISAILFVFFSNNFIVNGFISSWESFEQKNYSKVQQYSYGVVLSGMLKYNPENCEIGFMRSSDRIWQSLKLYKQKKIKKILISGGHANFFNKDTIESALLKNYLVNIGIPTNDIITEEKSKNTYENAVFTKELLSSTDTVLLITSASHMRRSYKCFKKAGILCDTFSTDFYYKHSVFNVEDIFFPSYKALQKWHTLFHEIVGIIAYKIAGYI